jgi:hypothetical protein
MRCHSAVSSGRQACGNVTLASLLVFIYRDRRITFRDLSDTISYLYEMKTTKKKKGPTTLIRCV